MNIDFHKYHALGNDYIVIDPNNTDITLTEEVIKLICHRNFGIGSDGILLGPIIEEGNFRLRILNPDGSEAEKSGNGIRIFSKYLVDAEYVKSNIFEINTLGGKVLVEVLDKYGNLIKVDMGKVTFDSKLIPVKGKNREVINEEIKISNKVYNATCLSIGNPHCVIPVDNISKDLAFKLGPLIENNIIFPNRINMQILKVRDRNNIEIEIWERGAGYTLASGSSSCAAASAAYKLGLVDNSLNVHMPGGIIKIDIHEDGHVFMTGEVSSVAKGIFANNMLDKLKNK